MSDPGLETHNNVKPSAFSIGKENILSSNHPNNISGIAPKNNHPSPRPDSAYGDYAKYLTLGDKYETKDDEDDDFGRVGYRTNPDVNYSSKLDEYLQKNTDYKSKMKLTVPSLKSFEGTSENATMKTYQK